MAERRWDWDSNSVLPTPSTAPASGDLGEDGGDSSEVVPGGLWSRVQMQSTVSIIPLASAHQSSTSTQLLQILLDFDGT